MKFYFTILFFSFLHFSSKSQIGFFKGYPSVDKNNSTAVKVIVTRDNQYIYNLTKYNTNSVISKLDMNGSIIWAKSFIKNPFNFEIIDFIESKDGNILAIGHLKDPRFSIDSSFVFKINSNGDFLWTMKMGGLFGICLSSNVELKAGDIIVTGTYLYNFNTYQDRFYIAKLNSIGTLVWGKTHFLNGNFDNNIEPFSVKTVVDENQNIWSIANKGAAKIKSILLCLNSSNGDTVLTKEIDSNLNHNFLNICATKDSNIFVSGYIEINGYNTPLISKFDIQGIQKWTLIFDNEDQNFYAIDNMFNIGDNDVLIYFYAYNRISRLDKNGVLKWTKTLNINSNNIIFSNYQTTSSKNEIFKIGEHYINNEKYNYVLRTDSTATIDCYNFLFGIKKSFVPLKYVSFDSLLMLNYIDTSSAVLFSSNKLLDTINLKTNVSFNSPTICLGQTAKIYSDADSCVWPNGFTILSRNSAKISPNQTTSYNIVGFKNGCDYNNKVTVSVIQTPLNNSISLLGKTLSTTQSGATYQWIKCNSNTAISGATSQSFTPTSNGSYAVVTKIGSCIDTSECKLVSISGISNFSEESIQIYPNPVVDNLKIDLQVNIDFINLKIYNLVGQLMFNMDIINKQSIDLNLSNFNKGFYYLVLDDKLKRLNYKFLKD